VARASDNPEAGFTLIELLVSLTVLAVILGLLTGGLRIISKGWDAHAEQIDVLDMMSRAADILRRDASGLSRVVFAPTEENARLLFRGDENHLSFVAHEPPFPTEPGPYYVDYSILSGAGGFDLIRSRAQFVPGMTMFPGASPANQVPLVQGPFQYRFSYAAREKGKMVWHSRWPHDRRIPELIRLDVIERRSGNSAAPAIVVAVPADAEVGCISKSGPCSSGGELKARASRQEAAKDKAKSKTGQPGGAADVNAD